MRPCKTGRMAGGGSPRQYLTDVLQLALDQAPHDVVHRLLDMQEVNVHRAGLPDPVRPVLSLQRQRTQLDTVLLLLPLKKNPCPWLPWLFFS